MTTQRLEQKARNVLAQAYGADFMDVAVVHDTVGQTYSVCYWPKDKPQNKLVLYLQER